MRVMISILAPLSCNESIRSDTANREYKIVAISESTSHPISKKNTKKTIKIVFQLCSVVFPYALETAAMRSESRRQLRNA